MENSSIITSSQNARIKHLLQLEQKSSARREEGLFVVEGMREVKHCADNDYEVSALFYCPELAALDSEMKKLIKEHPSFEVSKKVYERLAYRGSTEGIVAEFHSKNLALSDLTLSENPLILVLEGVEKPGNVGAVLRTADACGADAVVLCDALTDLYNPNLIRSSLGAVFTVPCVETTTAECIDFLKERGIQIITAQLQDSEPYYFTNLFPPTALIMGSEAEGLSHLWRESADAHVLIPMLGQLDSLNVSISTAVLAYEAVRQREPMPF